ncbi:hypothetical protein FSP39_016717 [Pinctada imbricata]|uniref:Uncharacterized protein n=1 Tax=Pinctada imbricata TaxID=66713 RepID=A0AA88YDI8_PINIB|nr:hypothetical protein FSP39_016717 [Pinctada imbricata]
MVANEMYDPVFNEVFELSNKAQAMESKWFDNGGEPIWVTNQKRCESHRTGVVFWPGDSARVKGYLPTQYLPYNPSTPNETRVDYITDWFTSKQPINLGLLYFEEPDGWGHWFGPDSQQVTDMIGDLDGVLGYLLQRLNETNLLDEVDIIITSDHGMAETPKNKVIDLDHFIDKYSYRFFSGNPIGNILPNAGVSVADLCQNLSRIQHAKVYKKPDIPDRYHYKSNRRIQPILIVPDEGFSLSYNGSSTPKGQHGYDNDISDMHPFFMAMGPSFKKGYKKDTFHTVDIYPLICHILGVEAAPNNGSFSAVKDLLIGQKNNEKSSDFTMVISKSIFSVLFLYSIFYFECNLALTSIYI